ncbi:hypothetical protein [Bradyrhizobium sp. CCGB20]|uniref:hypothetical protein n=1 Tax=Bradyrhizobium sp. CCGB20 TaxID=2949633 RepID=UPI0020B17F83|nr:hypothetical protein [Bradyrhizobium sp. CCGB20]MCP3398811.1 hypothetical protein [Bradyrhizobium sp. CCGB20]
MGIDTVSRAFPSALSDGARVQENSRLNSSPPPSGAGKERSGIRNLVDGAEVQLAELLCDAGVIADSYADLHSNILLYDDIAEITEIAEAEEPVMPMMSMMPMMMPVMSSAHGVEFRIDQFTHSTHDFPPRGLQ